MNENCRSIISPKLVEAIKFVGKCNYAKEHVELPNIYIDSVLGDVWFE